VSQRGPGRSSGREERDALFGLGKKETARSRKIISYEDCGRAFLDSGQGRGPASSGYFRLPASCTEESSDARNVRWCIVSSRKPVGAQNYLGGKRKPTILFLKCGKTAKFRGWKKNGGKWRGRMLRPLLVVNMEASDLQSEIQMGRNRANDRSL